MSLVLLEQCANTFALGEQEGRVFIMLPQILTSSVQNLFGGGVLKKEVN